MSTQNKAAPQKFDPVRAAAVEALVLIEQGEQTDMAVHHVTQGREFRPLDRRFLLQLVNGATKMRRRLDHEIKFYLSRPAAELPLKLSNILRLGFYQLRYTDRIPAAAAVSESVNLANVMTDRSRASLVNAVLRTSLREPDKVKYVSADDDPVKYLGDYYSYPDHFVAHCLREFGYEQTEKLLKAYNPAPRVTYRVNYLRSKPDEVARLLQEGGIEFSFGKYLPEFIHVDASGLPLEAELIKTGKVFVQDESAGLAVRLLNPRPDHHVIDLTSAPGGKATYAAIRMRNRGRVTAVDKSHSRLEVVVRNARRLGIKIIAPVASDMLEFASGSYDRVLLDPPCTGWGTAGKNSDLRWTKTADDIKNLVRIQTRMINHAAGLVKPGGVMVYSTCTIIRDENDQVVEEFLLRHDDFELESGAQFFHSELISERGFVKTYPTINGLDGSFCARLKRKPN
ncbi:MAG: 16S rRNA (cytosine(967)-C(5))-methyltransferase RsmB [candidate division Zixibacteria bacterium]|nr:16S rRNA (cytosine(967)-C(5))-methyltransferase RsmB [candidate division Zixibacteria bacterium]